MAVVMMMMMLLVVYLPMAKITNKYSIQFVTQSAKNVYLGTACNKSVGWSVCLSVDQSVSLSIATSDNFQFTNCR